MTNKLHIRSCKRCDMIFLSDGPKICDTCVNRIRKQFSKSPLVQGANAMTRHNLEAIRKLHMKPWKRNGALLAFAMLAITILSLALSR